MTSIAAGDLPAKLPELLSALAAGEYVAVTDDGRTVARLVPTPPAETPLPAPPLDIAARLRAMKEWEKEVMARADRYPPGFVADCDRDTIYGPDPEAP